MKKFIFIFLVTLILLNSGCNNKKQEPRTTSKKIETSKPKEETKGIVQSNGEWVKIENGYKRDKRIGEDIMSLQAFVVDENKDMMDTIKIVNDFLKNYNGSIYRIERSPDGTPLYKDCNTSIYYQSNEVVIESGATIGKWESIEEIKKRWEERHLE